MPMSSDFCISRAHLLYTLNVLESSMENVSPAPRSRG
jgi:hypothetical protein